MSHFSCRRPPSPLSPGQEGIPVKKQLFSQSPILEVWKVRQKKCFLHKSKLLPPPTHHRKQQHPCNAWGFSDNFVNFSPKTGKVIFLLILLRIQTLICGYCFAGLHFEVNFGRILIPNFRHILGFKLFDATCLTFQCHWRRKINKKLNRFLNNLFHLFMSDQHFGGFAGNG